MRSIVHTGGVVLDFRRGWVQAPAVMAQIRSYDPLLVVYFDQQVQRYCVARKTPRGLYFLTVWQDSAGGYLPLDGRLVQAVAAWDLRPPLANAPRTADELATRMDAEDTARVEKIRRDFDDDVSHATRDNRRQLVGALRRAFNE